MSPRPPVRSVVACAFAAVGLSALLALGSAPGWGWSLWALAVVAVTAFGVRAMNAAVFALRDQRHHIRFRESPNGNLLWWSPTIIPFVAAAPDPSVTGILLGGASLTAIYGGILGLQTRWLRAAPRTEAPNRLAWSASIGVAGISLWLTATTALGSPNVSVGDVMQLVAYTAVVAVLFAYLPWMHSTVGRDERVPGAGLRIIAGGLCLGVTPFVARLDASPGTTVAAALLSLTVCLALLEPVRRRDAPPPGLNTAPVPEQMDALD